MILIRLAVVVFVLCVAFTHSPSYAADSIAFIDKDAFKDSNVKALLSEHDFAQIAAIDLNNDSIDEYVLRRETDTSSRLFEVFAMTDSGLVSLASIPAQKLMLAYDPNHGVRSILGFTDAHNDYEYDVYAWDALSSSFSSTKLSKQTGGSQ